ncbi:putative monovalent cation/H+ antiporter subunit D [compost metagenome]
MFLLSDMIARQRGGKGVRLEAGPALLQPQLLGGLFFLGAIGIVGLPPFSGFLGKLMLLRAVPPGMDGAWLWALVLLGSLGSLVALSRAGSVLFWRAGRITLGSAERDGGRLFAAVGLLALSPLLVLFAQPVTGYLDATVLQLKDVEDYQTLILHGGGQ